MCIFHANFSGTLLIGWLVAVKTRVAFDRGRLCDNDFVVAKIRITEAQGTVRIRRTANFRNARIERRAPTVRTWNKRTCRVLFVMKFRYHFTNVTIRHATAREYVFTFFQNPKNVTFNVFGSVMSKKGKNVESFIQVSRTQIRLPVSGDYKIRYFPKRRLLGAL